MTRASRQRKFAALLLRACRPRQLAVSPTLAQTAAVELFPYAVHVDRTPKQTWPGYGVYLGGGYVLTAAHVVGRASETQPHVVVNGREAADGGRQGGNIRNQ